MCGGVGFKIKNLPKSELRKYYSPALIKRFSEAGKIESFFWEKNSVLPVRTKKGIQLKLWGNKDENIKLPKTGWAKIESIKIGKWGYLHPEIVDIPVDSGYEKKVWFCLPQGTKGVVVQKGNNERVYMITKEADEVYKLITKHDREPLGNKKFK
jgi:hypothetical protein